MESERQMFAASAVGLALFERQAFLVSYSSSPSYNLDLFFCPPSQRIRTCSAARPSTSISPSATIEELAFVSTASTKVQSADQWGPCLPRDLWHDELDPWVHPISTSQKMCPTFSGIFQ